MVCLSRAGAWVTCLGLPFAQSLGLCLRGLGVALGLLATQLLHPCLTTFPPPSHCPASLPLIQSLKGTCLKCRFLGRSLQGEAIKFGL